MLGISKDSFVKFYKSIVIFFKIIFCALCFSILRIPSL